MPGLFDYEEGRRLEGDARSFSGLIQAAMRRADTDNLRMLQLVFPEEWADLHARYNAAGGRLAGEDDRD